MYICIREPSHRASKHLVRVLTSGRERERKRERVRAYVSCMHARASAHLVRVLRSGREKEGVCVCVCACVRVCVHVLFSTW